MNPYLFIHFAAQNDCAKVGFFGIPTWYQYIPQGDFTSCNINNNFQIPGQLSYIAIAAVDIALYIAGMVAVAYVIYGGIQYVVSQGEPDKTKNAKNTIMNALIGMVVASIAIAVVSFVGNALGG
jgi:hypothetical protein